MSEQNWNPERYRMNAGYVSELGMPVVELLAPRPGERVLDLGCGDGTLASRLAALGCEVVAIDTSPDFVRAAAARGLDARLLDATAMSFQAEFDAVFSNAVLHWIKDADSVIARVHAALKPGGRFVAECGGHRCVATIVAALEGELDRRGHVGRDANPWYFPTAEEYGARLAKAGFEVKFIAVIDRPTPLPAGIRGFIETFAAPFVSVLPEGEREAYVEDVCRLLEPDLRSADGVWTADYTRLRFAAFKAPSR